MLTVYHNLGLGDHLLFCGLVHSIIDKTGEGVQLYCKNVNSHTVQTLYSGYPVELLLVNGDNDIRVDSQCLNLHRTSNIDKSFATFDNEIYNLANVPYVERWSGFKFNIPKTILPINSQEYAFVHDDFKRGFKIKPEYLPKCELYTPNKDNGYSILDYFLYILNANEVHVIDSCFRILTDQLYCSDFFKKFRFNKNTPKLFYHKYARPVETNGWHVPAVRSSNWEIIL